MVFIKLMYLGLVRGLNKSKEAFNRKSDRTYNWHLVPSIFINPDVRYFHTIQLIYLKKSNSKVKKMIKKYENS